MHALEPLLTQFRQIRPTPYRAHHALHPTLHERPLAGLFGPPPAAVHSELMMSLRAVSGPAPASCPFQQKAA